MEERLRQRLAGLSVERRAEVLTKVRAARSPTAAGGPRRRPAGAPSPATAQQRTLWFLDQLRPGQAVYNMPLYVRLSGELDLATLGRALAQVVDRHEALRTALVERDGVVWQEVAPAVSSALPIVDVPDEDAAVRHCQEFGRVPFDLARAPLWRAAVFRVDRSTCVFAFSVHHVVFDGRSADIFWNELVECYRADREGVVPGLADSPVDYPDFALWQSVRLSGASGTRLADFWRDQLSGSPVLALPTDHPRPARPAGAGAVAVTDLPPDLLDKVARQARAAGTTPFVVHLAAFWALLHHYADGQDDVVVGSPTDGRGRSELEAVIGMFANPVVLRGDLVGRPSFDVLIGRAAAVTRAALAHAELPFEHVVDAVRPHRDLSRSPLFDVSFTVADEWSVRPLGPIQAGQVHVDPGTARFDLSWTVSVGDRPVIAVEYRTDLYERATVNRMTQRYGWLLRSLLADPTAPVWRDDLERRLRTERPSVPGRRAGAPVEILDIVDVEPDDPVEPRTDTERSIAEEVFAPLLGRSPASVVADFFQIGGNSLQAAQVVSVVRRRFGVPLAVADFFQTPTVAGLAAAVDLHRVISLDDDALLDHIDALSEAEVDRLLATIPSGAAGAPAPGAEAQQGS